MSLFVLGLCGIVCVDVWKYTLGSRYVCMELCDYVTTTYVCGCWGGREEVRIGSVSRTTR